LRGKPTKVQCGGNAWSKIAQVGRTMKVLSQCPLLQGLDKEALEKLYSRGERLSFPRYASIIREAAAGSHCFVLLRGRVRRVSSIVSGSDAVLSPGDSFGEAVLVCPRMRRLATHVTLDTCEVMQFTADDIADLAVGDDLFRRHIIFKLLKDVQFFGSLSVAQRHALASIMSVQTFGSNDTIFHQGDVHANEMYVLLEGGVRMYRASVTGEINKDQPVAENHASSDTPWFGEMGPWTGQPRGATACTMGESVSVLVISVENFPDFLENVPSFKELLEANSSAFKKMNTIRATEEREAQEGSKYSEALSEQCHAILQGAAERRAQAKYDASMAAAAAKAAERGSKIMNSVMD